MAIATISAIAGAVAILTALLQLLQLLQLLLLFHQLRTVFFGGGVIAVGGLRAGRDIKMSGGHNGIGIVEAFLG